MATILKLPNKEKGILIITDIERDRKIKKDKCLAREINRMKAQWIVGMHANYWRAAYDDAEGLIDFMIGSEDDILLPQEEIKYPLLKISVANFNDAALWKQKPEEKFWDIINVGKAAKYKNNIMFFNVIRELYDQGHEYRVLHICPAPLKKTNGYHSDLEKVYEKMFTIKERRRFNLLSMRSTEISPFDLETLSLFYSKSKVFAFTSLSEHRPRTPGYAGAAGMPVVVSESVSLLYPKKLRRAPYLYSANNVKDFACKAIEAVCSYDLGANNVSTMSHVIENFSAENSIEKLKEYLRRYFNIQQDLLSQNLGLRLARHHGFGSHPISSVSMSLNHLIKCLESNPLGSITMEGWEEDPELFLAKSEDNFKTNWSKLWKRE